jgi:hypothetical protein
LRQEEQVVQNIIDETPVEDLLKDINNLKTKDKTLYQW